MTASQPNPRRVAAGRANRAKRGSLSSSSRQRLRDLAIQNRPWEKSTGPRSQVGIETVARNLPQAKQKADSPRSFVEFADKVLDRLRSFRCIENVDGDPTVVFGLSKEFCRAAERFEADMAKRFAEENRRYLESLNEEFCDEEPGGT